MDLSVNFPAVYFGKNFWATQGTPARAVPVDWQFTWNGHLCRIPTLYCSDAGLTLDILLFLDSEAVRAFCKKLESVDERRLTPLEERMLTGERPIPQARFIPRLINGASVQSGKSSSFTWIPFVPRHREDAAVAAVCAVYAPFCTPSDCFVCHRVHAAWPQPVPDMVQSLSLEVTAEPRWLPIGQEFTVSEVSPNAGAAVFLHPDTGVQHTLYINELDFLPRRHSTQTEAAWLPVIAYEIVPPLADCETPELMEAGIPPCESDGPVGVLLTNDEAFGPHGTRQQAACGWPRSTRGGVLHMALAGISVDCGNATRYSFSV